MAKYLLVVSIIGGILVTNMDHQDEQNEQAEYASMVCAGYWPDYQQLEPACHEN